jgi:hypothetical protein
MGPAVKRGSGCMTATRLQRFATCATRKGCGARNQAGSWALQIALQLSPLIKGHYLPLYSPLYLQHTAGWHRVPTARPLVASESGPHPPDVDCPHSLRLTGCPPVRLASSPVRCASSLSSDLTRTPDPPTPGASDDRGGWGASPGVGLGGLPQRQPCHRPARRRSACL